MSSYSPAHSREGEHYEGLTLYLRAHVPGEPSLEGGEDLHDVAPWLPSIDPDSLLAASLIAAAFPPDRLDQHHVRWELASSSSLPRNERTAAPLLVSDRRAEAVMGIGAIYDLLSPLLPHSRAHSSLSPTEAQGVMQGPQQDFQQDSQQDSVQQGQVPLPAGLALRAYLQRYLAPLCQHALYAVPETFNERVLPAYQVAYSRTTHPSPPPGVRGWLARRARQAAAVNEVVRLRTLLAPALVASGLSSPASEDHAARHANVVTQARAPTQLPSAGQDVFASSSSASSSDRARLGLPALAPGMGPDEASVTSYRFERAKLHERAWEVLKVIASFYQTSETGYLFSSDRPCTTDLEVYALLAPLLSDEVLRGTEVSSTEEADPLSYFDNLLRRPGARPVLQVVRKVQADLWPGSLGDQGAEWRISSSPSYRVASKSHLSQAPATSAHIIPPPAHLSGPCALLEDRAKKLSPPASVGQLLDVLSRGLLQASSALWIFPSLRLTRNAAKSVLASQPRAKVSDEDRAITRRRRYWIAGTLVGLVWWAFASGVVSVVVVDADDDEEDNDEVEEENDGDGEGQGQGQDVDGEGGRGARGPASPDSQEGPEVWQRQSEQQGDWNVDDEGYLQDGSHEGEWIPAEGEFDPDEVDPEDIDAHFEYDED